jgi:hypothetical protein
MPPRGNATRNDPFEVFQHQHILWKLSRRQFRPIATTLRSWFRACKRDRQCNLSKRSCPRLLIICTGRIKVGSEGN